MKCKVETGLFKIEIETDTRLETAVFEKIESILRLLAENSVVFVKDVEGNDGLFTD